MRKINCINQVFLYNNYKLIVKVLFANILLLINLEFIRCSNALSMQIEDQQGYNQFSNNVTNAMLSQSQIDQMLIKTFYTLHNLHEKQCIEQDDFESLIHNTDFLLMPSDISEIEEQQLNNIQLITHKKRYCCSYGSCEYVSNRKWDILKHKRIHTGERIYKCSYCSKTFIQKSHLITHELIHKEEKPYSCNSCKKTFTQKVNCIKHERTHTGEKPYICHYCDKTFTQKNHSIKHEQTQHTALFTKLSL